MKLSLLTFSLSLLSFCGFAQIENFDLSKYELANYNFRALENTLLLNGSYQNGKDQNSDNQSTQSTVNLNLKTRYEQFINSKEQQSSILATTKVNYQRLGRKGNDPNYDLFTEISSDFDRKFFHENEVFTGIGNQVNLTSAWGQGGKNYIYTRVFLPFSAGVGRIENVTDAWLSIRLLRDLEDLAILKNTPSEEQILTLAKFISQRQNLRFFDHRLKRIADIEELDKFLRKNGLVDTQNAKYFNSLYDQWLFGVNTMRQSGSAFTFRISPYGTLAKSGDDRGQISFGGLIGFEYTDFKPLNLKWQFNKSAGIHAGSLAGGVPNVITGLSGNYSIESQVELELGYFPNSRTFLSLNLNSIYKISDERLVSNIVIYPVIGFSEGISSQHQLKGFQFSSAFNAEYYLSPQTRLQSGFNLNYIQNSILGTCGVQSRNASPAERRVNCLRLNYELQFLHSFF